MTCQKLFTVYPKCYFWTFTFKDVYPDWWYPQHWDVFCKNLEHLYGGWIPGVRVIEPFPGGHGLHYHAIVGVRVYKGLVDRVGKRVGMGRTHVVKCDINTAFYLAKYLTKKSNLHRGMRKWGMMGGFVGVKKNDIQTDSIFHRNMAELFHGKKVGFVMSSAVKLRSEIYGPLETWPAGVKSELILSEGYAPLNRPSFIIEKRSAGEKILEGGRQKLPMGKICLEPK